MSRCENCGTDHKDGMQFCTECGRVLPQRNKGRALDVGDIAGVFRKLAGNEMFGVAFSGKAPPHASEAEPARDRKLQSTPDATAGVRPASRSAVIRTIARAAALGIAKSIALSIAVLGPGFVMLMMGMAIEGMIWLFCGSFAMMAWTYRKPWRLGVIACLVPPAAAAACYMVQLLVFGGAAPPLLFVGGAVLAGLAVGHWRAQTHHVTRSEDGGIIAERTIGYLFVWVAAYAVTQALGLIATGTLAVRAGLLTGAFSTAMLAMVSIVIWRQFRSLQPAQVGPAGEVGR
ncbi:MAG: zinc ribbon domain-containing protein [Nitratireductor sp.]|nr:zinc ribbon domain-containing protein [Nitratireductor sp.]